MAALPRSDAVQEVAPLKDDQDKPVATTQKTNEKARRTMPDTKRKRIFCQELELHEQFSIEEPGLFL